MSDQSIDQNFLPRCLEQIHAFNCLGQGFSPSRDNTLTDPRKAIVYANNIGYVMKE